MNIRQQWEHLSPREQRVGLVAAVILGLLLYYFLIYSPLSTGVEQYYQQIESNRSLITWMQSARQQIKVAATKQQNSHLSTTGSILVKTEESIKKSQLGDMVSEIKQTENEKVQVRFASISFEKLLSWLQSLTDQYQLNITKIILKRTTEDGVVSATVLIGS